MDLFKVVVTTVLTTLVVISLGAVAATALWPDSAEAHGPNGMRGFGHHGMHAGFASHGDHCARLGPRHTQLVEAYLSIHLGLTENQEQALQPVMQAVDRWRADAVETCRNVSITTLPEGLDVLQEVLSRSEQAVAEIAPQFSAFYATLTEEQQASMDSWVSHHNQNHTAE